MLNPEQVAEIKAAESVYRAADVARHYEVHRSTVTRIWAGMTHMEVRPTPEPPNIQSRTRTRELAEDMRLMLNRGATVDDVARTYGVSKRTVYAVRGCFM